jgi:hypothetical protein
MVETPQGFPPSRWKRGLAFALILSSVFVGKAVDAALLPSSGWGIDAANLLAKMAWAVVVGLVVLRLVR